MRLELDGQGPMHQQLSRALQQAVAERERQAMNPLF